MDLALFACVLALIGAIGVLVLFTVLVVAIRAEDRRHHLTDTGLSPIEVLSRRLLGTYAHHCPHIPTRTGRR